MGEDVAALVPSLIMCVAFLLGVGWFLRREMAPRRGGRARASGPERDAEQASPDHRREASEGLGRSEDA